MEKIRVSVEQMYAWGDELLKLEDRLDNVLTNLNKCADTLKSEWEGDSAERFYAQYTESATRIKKVEDYLAEFEKCIRQTADNYMEMDAQIAKAINGTFV